MHFGGPEPDVGGSPEPPGSLSLKGIAYNIVNGKTADTAKVDSQNIRTVGL